MAKKKKATKAKKKVKKEMQKPWMGRFRAKTAKVVEEFTRSLDYDQRLYRQDITGSLAYARALERAKILNEKEYRSIASGLRRILVDIELGKVEFYPELEDIHMNVEQLLIERVGEVGKKLHTGRSRNDQVVTDLRMYLKEEIEEIEKRVIQLERVLIDLAADNSSVIMPGFTHLQHAQPVLFAHHLLAYFEMLERDRERLCGAYARADVMPLGSGALAGAGYLLNRESLANELGFSAASANSIDAVSDRDFAIEFMFTISTLMMHLSRFSEEIILWSSPEFSFVELPDAYSTGSSMMPQKKNPDVAELLRGKTGRVYGHLFALLTILKALPLSYNRDLQEDKEGLFDVVDTAKISLAVIAGLLKDIKINEKKMEKMATVGYATATDLADYLVRKNIPFREAHSVVGRVVAYCLDKGKEFHELSLTEFRRFSNKFSDDIHEILSAGGSIKTKNIYGGTAPNQVKEALKRARERVGKKRS